MLSRETLEFCDWLIDGVTLAANADNFDDMAKKISAARAEVSASLQEAGGTPLAAQRQSS